MCMTPAPEHHTMLFACESSVMRVLYKRRRPTMQGSIFFLSSSGSCEDGRLDKTRLRADKGSRVWFGLQNFGAWSGCRSVCLGMLHGIEDCGKTGGACIQVEGHRETMESPVVHKRCKACTHCCRENCSLSRMMASARGPALCLPNKYHPQPLSTTH